MKKYIIKIIVAFIIASIALGIYIYHAESRKPVLEIYFFHLNRGRSVLVRTPNDKSILIDGGQTGDIVAELTKVFPFYRRRIDVVVVTSPVPKNVGGLVSIIDRYEIGKVIEPYFTGTSTALLALDNVIKEKGMKVEREGNFEIDGVRFRKLFNEPLVLEISYASTTIILLGDVSKKDQRTFLVDVNPSNIVEYSHSGADSRVFADLFNKLNSDQIVITKKETSRVSTTKTKKKFDIEKIDQSKIVNLEKEGTRRFVFE